MYEKDLVLNVCQWLLYHLTKTNETKPSTQRVSGKLSISWSSLAHYLHNLGKSIQSCLNCASHYQNIAKLLTHSSKCTFIFRLWTY